MRVDYRLNHQAAMLLGSLYTSSHHYRIKAPVPPAILRDKPEIRFPLIGEKTKEYELSLLQEDYAHHGKLVSFTKSESKIFRGRLGNKLLCPICTGSGLTSIANLPKDWNIEVSNESFKTCSGWISGWNDCFAKKGFQIPKITPPLRESLFFVNTHLDAGSRISCEIERCTYLSVL